MTTENAARQKGRKETGALEIEEDEGLEGAGAGKVQWNLAPRYPPTYEGFRNNHQIIFRRNVHERCDRTRRSLLSNWAVTRQMLLLVSQKAQKRSC